jgi:ubiquinone/menaquinone biosynthesis C-methylase UbiE
MAQGVEKIGRFYDGIATEYADKFSSDHERKPKDREILSRFAREIGDRRPVWDFGCGPAQTTGFLNDLGVDIGGLDFSGEILEQARARHPGIPFQKGNFLDLTFESDSIAGVVAFYAIVHFSKEQVRRAFREIFRVLQPGGLFLLAYHIGEDSLHLETYMGKPVDIDFMFFSNQFIISSLEASGFERIALIERDPYPDIEFQSRRAYGFAYKPVQGGP